MAQTFSLGTLAFTGWEVTDNLKLPRRTALSLHEIPQTDDSPAEKIAQTFGTFADAITIQGTFLGENADDRMRQLESLQDAQAVVPFVSGPRVFDVLIADVEPGYFSLGEINFTVTLEPLLDRRSTSSSSASDPSTLLSNSLDTITSLADNLPQTGLDPSVYSSLAAIKSSYASIGALAIASIEDKLRFVQTLRTAINSISTQLQILRQATGVSSLVQQLEALSGVISSSFRTLQTYTGQSSVSPSIRVANTSIYAIAAQYTGDWKNFRTIMDANGLSDPMISDATYITIPRV